MFDCFSNDFVRLSKACLGFYFWSISMLESMGVMLGPRWYTITFSIGGFGSWECLNIGQILNLVALYAHLEVLWINFLGPAGKNSHRLWLAGNVSYVWVQRSFFYFENSMVLVGFLDQDCLKNQSTLFFESYFCANFALPHSFGFQLSKGLRSSNGPISSFNSIKAVHSISVVNPSIFTIISPFLEP